MIFGGRRHASCAVLAWIRSPTWNAGGWKTGKMFMRYAITDDRDQREAQQAIDAALAAPRRPTFVP
jgi:hypothetical protein